MVSGREDHTGPGDRIMVVVAHPDDAEFMCSGSVARWVREGREVVYVLATSGDKGTSDPNVVPAELAKLREQEQRNACDVLGVKAVEFLRYEDGVVMNDLKLRRDIVRMIRKHKPSAVVCQNPTARWGGNYINHPDHRNTGDATMDAVFPSARDYHMFPELRDEGLMPHIVPHLYLGARGEVADVFFDITDTIDLKAKALRCHASQAPDPNRDYGEFVRTMAKNSASGTDFEYVEGFKYFYLGQQ